MARTVVPITSVQPPKASFTTACAGANNDLVYTAKYGGPGGNSIRLQYIVGGTNTVLSVAVNGFDILVTVATDGGGAASSIASAVSSAVSAIASDRVTIANAGGNDGTGIVAAISITNLTGGSLQTTPPTQTNGDSANNHYFTGNDGSVMIEVVSSDGGAQTVTILYGPLYAPIATVAGQAESIGAGLTRLLGPFSTGAFDQNGTHDVYFNTSVSTNLKFRAYQVVKQS